MQNYLERIVWTENKTDNFQQKTILPDNSIALTFQFGSDVFEVIDGAPSLMPKAGICGPLTKAKIYVCAPGSRTLLVKLKPGTAGFFGEAFMEDANRNRSLVDFFGEPELTKIKADSENSMTLLKKIIDLLTPFFEDKSMDASVAKAIGVIRQVKGQIKVSELSSNVCNSKRNLERKFKAGTGLTPKQFIIHSRFQHVLRLLRPGVALGEISYLGGYYDSSHLINECKAITGFTPEIMMSKLCRIYPMDLVTIPATLHHKVLLSC